MKTDGSPRLDQPLQLLDLAPDVVRRVDAICDYFEHQLYIEGQPRIEELLGGFDEPERSVLLRELLLLELETCLSRDTSPNRESYIKRFPGHERLVREVFECLFPSPPAARPDTPARECEAIWPNIPNYQILRRLGAGGMGEVFEAIHTKLGTRVAMKVLKANLVSDLEAEARFEREMRVIGTLSHPNIISARDAGQAGDHHYLVMEYVEGLDLEALVKRLGTLPVPEACEIARSVALALEHADQHRLVHRDIKPKNVLLGRCVPNASEVEVKVVDFGLASLRGYAALRDPKFQYARVAGTFAYMAPEQYWEQTSDVRSDIYSLGCTLYCLLLGRPPFTRPQYQDYHQVMEAHRSVSVAPFRKLRPDVSETLEQLVLTMIAKAPENRVQTPSQLAEALLPFTAGRDLQGLLARAEAFQPVGQGARFVLPELAPSTTDESKHTARQREGELEETLAWELPGPTPDFSAGVPDTSLTSPIEPPHESTAPTPGPESARRSRWRPRRLDLAGIAVVAAVVLMLGVAWWSLRASSPSHVDLLALVDLSSHGIQGDWTFDGRTLVSPQEPDALLQLPWPAAAAATDPPPEQYQLQIEVEHASGARFLAVGLVWRGQADLIVLDALVIAGPGARERPSYDAASIPPSFDFHSGPPRTYTCIVRREGVLAAYENQVLCLRLAGEEPAGVGDKRLAGNLPRTALFLRTRGGVYRFTKIELTPLDR